MGLLATTLHVNPYSRLDRCFWLRTLIPQDLLTYLLVYLGFPGGSSGKESACNTGDTEDVGSIPGSGRYPGEENGNPL